jgi:hypothetical protein
VDLTDRKKQEDLEICVTRNFQFYTSTDIRMIKSRMTVWAIHVVRTGMMGSVQCFGCEV